MNCRWPLQEFNSFYDRVGDTGEDDPAIDIYQAAWGVGIDVNPSGLYGRDAIYNFPRWSHEENDRLLAQGISEEAFDPDKRKEIYKQWQQLMTDEVPVFPTLYRSVLVPVNNRVHNYAIGDGTGMYRHEIAVSQEKSIVADKISEVEEEEQNNLCKRKDPRLRVFTFVYFHIMF